MQNDFQSNDDRGRDGETDELCYCSKCQPKENVSQSGLTVSIFAQMPTDRLTSVCLLHLKITSRCSRSPKCLIDFQCYRMTKKSVCAAPWFVSSSSGFDTKRCWAQKNNSYQHVGVHWTRSRRLEWSKSKVADVESGRGEHCRCWKLQTQTQNKRMEIVCNRKNRITELLTHWRWDTTNTAYRLLIRTSLGQSLQTDCTLLVYFGFSNTERIASERGIAPWDLHNVA